LSLPPKQVIWQLICRGKLWYLLNWGALEFASACDTELKQLRQYSNGLQDGGLVSSPQHPDQLQGPASLLLNGFWRLFPRGVEQPEHEAHHSAPSGA
jgi:hypothetical protein